jgi:radical SAM protein with 4Fe4S-binding SPASM domain
MTTFEEHPIIMWELTRACDLHCRNCTIGATERRGPNELTTYEAYKTIDQIAALAPRELIITGGDPLERDDVLQIVDYARRRGLDPAMVASPTSQLTPEAIRRLVRNGLTRMIFSLDGASPEIHQAVRGVAGTFALTLQAIQWAREARLEIEINTLVTRHNAYHLPALAELLRAVEIRRWNLYFLVPMTAAAQGAMLTAGEVDQLFATIDELRAGASFAVRMMEAPHYRRHLLQRELESRLDRAADGQWADFSGYVPGKGETQQEVLDAAVDGARGFAFISHAGDVRPSEFLLFSAGNLRYRSLGAIYRGSDLFTALRDPANFTGKCGRCEFRHLCGGSRARAWAMAGDAFADDPLCHYQPGLPLPLPTIAPAATETSS